MTTTPRRWWRPLAAVAVIALSAGCAATAVPVVPATTPAPLEASTPQAGTLEDRVALLECRVDALDAGTPTAACDTAPTTTSPTGTATPTTTTTATPPPPTTTTTVPPTTTTAAPTTTPASGQPIVTRSGRQLLIGGQPYKFVGFNADTWLGCWARERDRTTEANLDRFFRELPPRSVTRVWVYRNDPDSVSTLRRIVTAAERHRQYLMVTLSDGNDGGTQCGSLKGSGYPADGGPVLAHARALVPQFAATPAIAFWEIVNEGSSNPSAAAWYAAIGKDLKRLDPNTLVVGGAGTCWNGTDIRTCQPTSDPAWNDLVNLHEYDWSNGRVSHHAQNTEALAASLGLPWFSGESGLCCGGGPAGLTEAQAGTYLSQEWNAYLNAPGSVGMLYWDQKWGAEYASPSTVTMGDPAWEMARAFRHAWNR